MVEAKGIDRSVEGEHLTIDEGKSILSERGQRRTDRNPRPCQCPGLSNAGRRDRGRLSFGPGGAAGRSAGALGALVVLRRAAGEFHLA